MSLSNLSITQVGSWAGGDLNSRKKYVRFAKNAVSEYKNSQFGYLSAVRRAETRSENYGRLVSDLTEYNARKSSIESTLVVLNAQVNPNLDLIDELELELQGVEYRLAQLNRRSLDTDEVALDNIVTAAFNAQNLFERVTERVELAIQNYVSYCATNGTPNAWANTPTVEQFVDLVTENSYAVFNN